MKIYSEEEKKVAESNLPKPLYSFFNSPELSTSFIEIQKEMRFNLRQTSELIDTVALTLLGLEEETNLGINLHQALPELDTNTLNKLLEELNNRILKEAHKKLKGGGA